MKDENSTPRQGSTEGALPEQQADRAETTEETMEQTTEVTSGETRDIGQASGEVAAPPEVERVPDVERVPEDTLIEQQPIVEARPPAPLPSVQPSPAVTSTVAPQGGLVTVRTGPRPGAILLGLLCLMVSTYTIVRQTTGLRLDFSLAGPVSIGALGTLLLLIGLVGLAGRRRT
jgi:hypothetical protein